MFFVLSKVLGFFAAPSNLFMSIGLLGLVLLFTRFTRLASWLVVTSLVLLAVAGLSPLGNALILPLEERFPTPEAEVGFATGRLHSFRHYFCSTCANNGVPEQIVMAWLGHRDSAMVKHYYHLHDEEAQRQMNRLNFLGKTGGNGAIGQVS